MAYATAAINGYTASTGTITWNAYNTGTAVGMGSATAYLNDTNANTYLQLSYTGVPFFVLGTLALDTVNPTTGGSAVTRVRPVVRVKAGGGNTLGIGLRSEFDSSITTAASADTLYAGAWASSGTAYTAWSATALNALQVKVALTSTSQKLTRAYLELDLSSVPAGTPSIAAATTDRPTINWNFADADGGGQAFASVKVFSSAVYSGAGFDAGTSVALFSTVVTGTATTVTPGSAIVTNGLVYRPYVAVSKAVNGVFVSSSWTAAAAASTASFTAPTAPTVTPTWDATNRRVSVDIVGGTGLRYTLTRGGTVVGTALTSIGSSGTATVLDYLAPRGTAQVYAATLTSAATASPVLTSSTATGTVTTGTATTWEVRALAAPTTVVDFATPVSGIAFSRAEANTVMRPLGSTKSIVVAGDMTGDDGSLEWVTDTRAKWETLKSLLTYQGPLQLTSPFRRADGSNEQWVIRLTTRSWDPDGTTTTPVHRAQADFVEVDPVDSSTY